MNSEKLSIVLWGTPSRTRLIAPIFGTPAPQKSSLLIPPQDYSFMNTETFEGLAPEDRNSTIIPRRAQPNPHIPAFLSGDLVWGAPPSANTALVNSQVGCLARFVGNDLNPGPRHSGQRACIGSFVRRRSWSGARGLLWRQLLLCSGQEGRRAIERDPALPKPPGMAQQLHGPLVESAEGTQ